VTDTDTNGELTERLILTVAFSLSQHKRVSAMHRSSPCDRYRPLLGRQRSPSLGS
jgi:hypothetical protein